MPQLVPPNPNLQLGPDAGSNPIPVLTKDTTPMMAQFIEIKAANADSLLFYRMGDFFELFFDDAITASQVLGITLTKRGKHNGQDIPMCGVPVKRADEYLQKLIAGGFKVAVCEQLEDPAEAKKRGAKAVVKRDVVRLVTSGTITEENLLDARENSFLTAIYLPPVYLKPDKNRLTKKAPPLIALASVDISTGEFYISQNSLADLAGELTRLSPKEILVGDTAYGQEDFRNQMAHCEATLSPVPATNFQEDYGKSALKKIFKVSQTAGYGDFTKGEWAAIAAVLRYIEITQIDAYPTINPPQHRGNTNTMQIDAATRISLEVIRSTTGERANSLLGAVDYTVSASGSRELARLLSSPSTCKKTINQRLDSVDFFYHDGELREEIRTLMKGAPDISRAFSRLSLGRGGPRDLVAVSVGLQTALHVGETIKATLLKSLSPPELLEKLADNLQKTSAPVADKLVKALTDDPPLVKRDGGFILAGYLPQLDEARQLRDQGKQYIADLQKKYIEQSGVKNLKVKHNNVLGYFIEVTTNNAAPLETTQNSKTFFHRQSLANSKRYSTEELAELENKINKATEQSLELELQLFDQFVDELKVIRSRLTECARALAYLDHFSALAELADQQRYVRPVIDDSKQFYIEGGRHPVVEKALKKQSEAEFIENDCFLGEGEILGKDVTIITKEDNPLLLDEKFPSDHRIWLLTGPNMSGKSTFLRQNALITILAQTDSFVPAKNARIGIVDRLFSRVGASDDLARGRSTFMVEMVETAGILNQATEKSLVILDEIGRGTATYDGLAIAWATLEHLHDVNHARALFATHYHELTSLTSKLMSVTNATVAVREWEDSIVFLHKIKPGAADRSYGIMVARLAGLPDQVIARAQEVLEKLESDKQKQGSLAALEDLPLFSQTPKRIENKKRQKDMQSREVTNTPSRVETFLETVDPDALSPRAALDVLYQLQAMRKQKN